MAGEKTEKPTPKKLKEARQEGRIARSQDFSAWVGLLVASVLIPYAVRSLTARVREAFEAVPAFMAAPEPEQAVGLLAAGLRGAVLAVLPMAAGVLAACFAVTAAQGGIYLTGKMLKPKWNRLSFKQGLKRMFGMHSIWEAVKALLKTAVLAYVLWRAMQSTVKILVESGQLPLGTVAREVVDALLVRTAAATGLAVAAADYAVVRFRLTKSLRMSKQDIKDEYKKSEGDPHVKGQIRSRQMAMSRNRMMAAVGDADVVMVNPVHVAVALRYDPAKGAPRVVAKGSGALAAKIREKAGENRVPMVENVPLARALHRVCDIGQEVPPELYNAVARVLAFVLSLKARGSGPGLHRPHIADEGLKSAHLLPKGRRPRKAGPSSGKRTTAAARP
jgi:flagellar biosynthetic protein FlhB